MKSIIPTEAYPLTWPAGAPRTPETERKNSHFAKVTSTTSNGSSWRRRVSLTVGEEIQRVRDEVQRIPGAEGLVISTNLPTRDDGLPKASASANGKDPGVAVYWAVRKRGRAVPYVMPCDTYDSIADNLHAIALSVEAMRGLDRWGAVKLEQAFSGFAALPPGATSASTTQPWRDVIGGYWPEREGELEGEELLALVKQRFRKAMEKAHPDKGGDPDLARRLNVAMQEAEAELGGEAP